MQAPEQIVGHSIGQVVEIPSLSPPPAPAPVLPAWADELIALYRSGAVNQFVLYGNVYDRMVLPLGGKWELGNLNDFLLRVLMPRFDVILSYDLGNGIRVEKAARIFKDWPAFRENSELPKQPRPAAETLTHYFRYGANLSRIKGTKTQIGCLIKAAHLVAPGFARRAQLRSQRAGAADARLGPATAC